MTTRRAAGAVVHLRGYCLTVEGAALEPEELARQIGRVGTAVLNELDGSFILAVTDAARQECWCATDPAGTQALYYRLGPDRVTITTSPKDLAAGLESAEAVDPDGLLAFLNSGYPWGESTLLRDWKALGPGRLCAIRGFGQISVQEYFRPEADAGVEAFASPEALIAELDRILLGIAGRRRRILVPLSGGVDSRLLAVRCARLGIPFETVTFVADRRLGHDDFGVARRLSAALGVRHHPWPWQPPGDMDPFRELVVAAAGTNAAFTSYPDGLRLCADLARKFDCVLRGDQVFGRGPTVATFREAAALLHIRLEDNLARWLAAGARSFDPVEAVLARAKEAGPGSCGEEADRWKNLFYRKTRIPRFVMPVARWQARAAPVEYPYLRRSFLCRMVRCTVAQRGDKAIARQALAQASAPTIQAIAPATQATWPGGEPLLCLPLNLLEEMAADLHQPAILDEVLASDRVASSFRQRWALARPNGCGAVLRWLMACGRDRLRQAFGRPILRSSTGTARAGEVPDHLLFKRLWAARTYLMALSNGT